MRGSPVANICEGEEGGRRGHGRRQLSSSRGLNVGLCVKVVPQVIDLTITWADVRDRPHLHHTTTPPAYLYPPSRLSFPPCITTQTRAISLQ